MSDSGNQAVRRLARAGQAAVLAALTLFVLVFAIAGMDLAFSPDKARMVLRDEFELAFPINGAPRWTLWLGGLLYFLPDLVGMLMLAVAYRLFRGIRRLGVFVNVTGQRVRLIGGLLLAIVPVGMVSEMLGSFVLSMSNPEGQRSVRLSLDDTDVYAIIVGLVLLIFGHIMAQALEIAEENERFV